MKQTIRISGAACWSEDATGDGGTGRTSGAGLAVIAATLLLGVSSPAADTGSFRHVKDLSPTGEVKRNIAAVELDEEVLGGTQDDYSDLRVVDSSSTAIPVLTRTKRRKAWVTEEHDIPVKELSLEVLPDNRIQIILEERQAGQIPATLVLSTDIRDYEKKVTVHGSPDRLTWTMLAENSPIFDYSRFLSIRNSSVALKGGEFQFYRIEIANISEAQQSPLTRIVQDSRDGKPVGESREISLDRKDFRIDRIRLVEQKKVEVGASVVTRAYSATGLSIRQDAQRRQTEILFEVPNAPVTRIEIDAENANFSREARVEASDAAGQGTPGEWRLLATTTISKINLGSFSRQNSVVEFGQCQRYRRYRVTIVNQDSPPLTVRGVKVSGEAHEAVFFVESAKTCQLYYGGVGVDPARYDIADVLRRAGETDTDAYSSGPQRDNPGFKAPAAARGIGGKTLLVLAILAMTAVLVWLIAMSARKAGV